MAPRINKLTVKNLRSVGAEGVTLEFPTTGPLVLLGENNAGKSNITRALDILFGEMWPGSQTLEDHDFHGRDSDGIAVELRADVSDYPCPYDPCRGQVSSIHWTHDEQDMGADGKAVRYGFSCNTCRKTFANNRLRSSLSATILDSDRRLDYQLSYASKYTMLSKLMRRFHERLLHDPDRKNQLVEIFQNLLAEFQSVPEFAAFKEVLAEKSAEFGQNLPYALGIDFSAYDPSNFFRSLRVHPTLEGDVRSFDELGTGQAQVLALAFAYAYGAAYGGSEGMLLVVDEPEANLHPLAQQWLAHQLNELSHTGVQVVVTTHSPHFIDLSKPENLVMVSKDEDGATRAVQKSLSQLVDDVVSRGAPADRVNAQIIGQFYSAGATTEITSGLFARRCVLVEGRTEFLALPELLRVFGFDPLREGVAIVPVDGIGNIAKWHRLYTALGIDTYCVFDTDADKANNDDPIHHRMDIAAALELPKGDPAAAEGVEGNPVYVTDSFALFNPNFEGAMTGLFGDAWRQLDTHAQILVGDSKPLRARYVAQHISATEFQGDARITFDCLVRAISGAVPNPVSQAAPSTEPDEQNHNHWTTGDPWESSATNP